MRKNRVQDMFNMSQKAVSQALGSSRKLNNQPTDPDIIKYSKLDEKDFNLLRQRFGDVAVAGYIKQMEAKKLESQHG